MTLTGRTPVVVAIGTAQTLGFASTYYLPAILAAPMARELGVGTASVFAAFSVSLAASALVGPVAGRMIDRQGGKAVLMGSSLLFAAGLLMLALAQGLVSLVLAWVLIGVAMGSGLYEAAFSTLVRLYGQASRGAITGVTLLGGFASTLGWPLSTLMELHWGWRGACVTWAALHLVIGLPLYALLPGAASPPAPRESAAGAASTPLAAADPGASPQPAHPALTTALLGFVFAATWFISTAMAAHLPSLLQASGVGLAAAVGVAALVGPAQVAGRLLEFGLVRRVHPLWSARVAAMGHPVGVLALVAAGPLAAPVFAVMHGAGIGILTIAKGTLPLALFGPGGYGARQGWLMLPGRIGQALAPWLFGLALDQGLNTALCLSAGVGLAAWVALLALRASAR